MSTSGSLSIGEQLQSIPPRAVAVAAVAVAAITVLAAYLSTTAFVVSGLALLALLGLATARWPRVMLVVLVLSPPLIDLYAGQRLLPEQAQSVARLFSEALLLVMTAVLAVVAARRGTLVPALRHPVTVAIGVFLAVTLASAIVNVVPPTIASAGIIFTLDAAVLFYLPRMVGYSHEERNQALWAVAAVVTISALLAIGQTILTPDLLGADPVVGRSGEGVRPGSLVRDPNILGTLIGLTLPFTMFSLVRQPPGRRRWLVAGAAFALTLALLLTYSRGSWQGVIVGFGIVALLIDRRALLAFIVILALAYPTAVFMPKGLLTGGGASYDPVQTTITRLGNVPLGRDLRMQFIKNGIPIFEDHPWLGVGPGRYGGAAASIFGSPIYAEYRTDKLLRNQETVDNFWLHLGIEVGVLGTIAFITLVLTAAYAPIRALRGAIGSRFAVPAGIVSGVVVVSVATITTMLLEGNTVAFLFWFLLGLGSMTWPAAVRTGDPPGSATASAG
jgi:O-antigen ligase